MNQWGFDSIFLTLTTEQLPAGATANWQARTTEQNINVNKNRAKTVKLGNFKKKSKKEELQNDILKAGKNSIYFYFGKY